MKKKIKKPVRPLVDAEGVRNTMYGGSRKRRRSRQSPMESAPVQHQPDLTYLRRAKVYPIIGDPGKPGIGLVGWIVIVIMLIVIVVLLFLFLSLYL